MNLSTSPSDKVKLSDGCFLNTYLDDRIPLKILCLSKLSRIIFNNSYRITDFLNNLSLVLDCIKDTSDSDFN